MNEHNFHDEISLAEEAEKLGKKAMKLGLIPSFTIHLFPDSWQFYIPSMEASDALTPEKAYLYFKKIIEQSDN